VTPFLTFLTPTYRRPKQLVACLQSVQQQTAVEAIQQIVLPDHLGVGVGGMFQKLPAYAPVVQGEYVHILCDDDVLAGPTVVADVQAYAKAQGNPPLIIVDAQKAEHTWPAGQVWPPIMGNIDLGCGIVRADVWKRHVEAYGSIYEGDFLFFQALAAVGIKCSYLELLFSVGAVSRGAAEAAA
jgi:hypothetical protein